MVSRNDFPKDEVEAARAVMTEKLTPTSSHVASVVPPPNSSAAPRAAGTPAL